jgi:hypothetical protein
VRTLREPVRGISEGLVAPKHPHPFRLLGQELLAVVPPFNLIGLRSHPAVLRKNLIMASVFALGAWGLIWLTGSVAQWVTTGFGVWVTFTWAQSLKIRDPATYNMMFGSKAFIYTMLAFPSMAFIGYGAGFWIPPLILRVHDVGVAEVGLYIGIGAALGGFVGITSGGMLADKLKTLFPSGRIVLGYVVIAGKVPLLLWLLYTDSLVAVYIINFFLTAFSACAGGVPPSTAADLVMPRMRAVAGAYYILLNTFIGLALGPYVIGQISVMLGNTGMDDATSLRGAIALAILCLVPALFFLIMAQRHLPKDEASRLERAAALGEDAEVQMGN